MKRTAFIVAAFCAAGASAAQGAGERGEEVWETRQRTTPPQVRVMTYNVRYSAGDR